MPLYHFHLRNAAGLEPDEIGLEYPTLEEAYLEACRTVPGMAAEFVQAGRNPMEYAFEIADESGTLLLEIPFGEMLRNGAVPRRPALPRERARAVSAAERTQQLVASINRQIETLHEAMLASRRIMEEATGRRR